MRYFKATGLWSTSEDAKHPIAGTLRFSATGLRLLLIGNFKSGWSPRVGTSYPTIHGVVGKSPYGDFVTLYNCFTQQTTMNMVAVGSETIACQRAIVGDDHPPPGDADYESLDLRFTYLDSWIGWRNIRTRWQPGDGSEVVLSYTRPELIPFTIGDTTLKVGYSLSVADSMGHACIKEKAHLFIGPIKNVTADKASDEYSFRLQNLLTFATDTPNAVEESVLQGGLTSYGTVSIPKKYHLIYNPVFSLKGRKERPTPNTMLFSLNDAREAGLNIFGQWFDFVNRYEAFCTVYFAYLYAPPKYLEDKFRNVMTAFTLLCRSALGTSEQTKSFLEAVSMALRSQYNPQEQAYLIHTVPDEAEAEMPFHLLRLLEENGEVMSKIINGGFQEFVVSVCRTFAFVTRRTLPGGQPVLEGSDLYYAAERIRWLIKAIVLKELGFSEQQARTFIERNINFIFLKAV